MTMCFIIPIIRTGDTIGYIISIIQIEYDVGSFLLLLCTMIHVLRTQGLRKEETQNHVDKKGY